MSTNSLPIRRILMFAVSLGVLAPAAFAETVPPARKRFAERNTTAEPDFQRHVVPLLGRLGCNGRACHGSFQGRGGFRLSLFGYDFKMDHKALTGPASSEEGTRIDPAAPDDSLILRKPTLRIDHEGGERFETGSWEHHLLLRWIETGARGAEAVRELDRLEATPGEIVFHEAGERRQLQILAVWKDGVREDVTCLCRFRTNNDSIVTVDADGQVCAADPGDTHVIAFYDNGVIAVPVMRPLSDRAGDAWPGKEPTGEIDRLVARRQRQLGIVPSPPCSDAEFLRRVSIDMTGTLPTPAEIEAFLADSSPDKRERKIDELLERPTYAAWWANKLCDFTGCNPREQSELGQDFAGQWYAWIFKRLRQNVPYDRLVEQIVLATGRRDGESYDEYAARMSSYFRDKAPANFADRNDLPHYWTRRSMAKPKDKALAFAHSFLGIRLQCAQCHKHPWDQWTQEDFREFSRFFENIEFGVAPDDRERYRKLAAAVEMKVKGDQGSPVRYDALMHARQGRTIPWRELYLSSRSKPTELSLLRSRRVKLKADEDPRSAIMRWMREPDNPWFARALVNRVWAGYFNVGIVDPPDDLNLANPPSNPELLDWLSDGFVESGYDMKWLHRQIARSAAYQRSWRPNETNREDRRHYSRAIPRRIPAEVVYDALKQATAATDRQEEVRRDLTRRAVGYLSMRMAGTYAMQTFGKPERAVNCDCERVSEPTLLQSIFLQNDPLVQQRVDSSEWIREIAEAEKAGKPMDSSGLIRAAWLRTVCRPPTDAEAARAKAHFEEAGSLAEATADLMWALVNSKEFILNH